MAKRLVLIDGHAIIHRAYHALPPLTSSSGQLVNAVYGFASMLLRVIEELKPTHMAVCFDLPGPTFRHEAYIGYQAKRPVMDKELSSQIELVHEVVTAAGIPIYIAPGFEADDVLGTLARQAARTEVVIVTGDRDILQLVGGRVKVYMTIRGLADAKMFGEKDVEEYIGVKPSQIVDYKALIGDSSDNYPGATGIGPKTALSLLGQFDNIENIYKNLDKIPGKVAGKLKDGHDGAILSQNLAQIRTDAPVELDLEKAKLSDLAKNEKFVEKLREFRFRSLVARLGEPASAKVSARQGKTNGQMGLI